MRILLIDDRRERRNILREALGDAYETREAESARSVRQEQPDLILISLFLSGRICLPCIEQSLAADVPVLVYADLDDEAAEAAALEAGAEDVIIAPFRPVVLRRRVENILKRRRYEIERQRSAVDREMRILLENLPIGIGVYRIGPEAVRHEYINHRALELFGFDREDESALKAMGSALFVDFDESALERFRALKTPVSTNHVYPARRKDGSAFWVQSIACTQIQPDGSLLCYTALADATPAEQARQELEDSRNQIRSIFERLPGAVATFELVGEHVRMTYLSDGCEKVTGYTAAEFLARCQGDILLDVHPDDRARLRRLTPEDAAQHRSFSHTFRVRCKDGDYRWLNLSLAPFARAGKLLYYGVYTDVSGERETELMMNQLVNALPGGVVIYRFHEKGIETEYYSDGIPRLSGHTREEYEELVRLNPIDNIVFEDDMPQMLKVVGECSAVGAPISITYRIRHKNGSLVWLQLSARKIREEGGYPVYYAVFTKPTEEFTQYRKIVEDSSTAVFIAQQEDRKLILANRAWKSLREIDESRDVTGQRLMDVIPPQDVLFTDEEVRALPLRGYQEFHTRSSLGRYMHIWAQALEWGGRRAYIAYIVDETELARQRAQLQHLIDRVPGGIGIYTVEKGVPSLTYINGAYYRMLGYDGKRKLGYMGENTVNTIFDEDKPVMMAAVGKLAQGEKTLDVNYRVLDAQGEWKWLRLVGHVVERQGDTLTVYASFFDFDHFMKAQRELEASRAMLDTALSSAKVMVWRYDPRTHAIIDSGSLGKRYGFPPVFEDATERLLRSGFIHPDDANAFRAMVERIPQEEHATADVRFRMPDGHYAWRRMVHSHVLDERGQLAEVVGASIDIAEQKERERSYEEQLHLKRLLARGAKAVAFYNLTKNVITECESDDPALVAIMKAGNVDDVLRAIREDSLDGEEKFAAVRDCAALLAAFRAGQTRLVVRHHRCDETGWMESCFDLMANPFTGDVEALSVLRDVTEMVRAEQVVSTLMQIDYEAVFTLDAATGQPTPLEAGRLDDVVAEQAAVGDYVRGVESYIRKYCTDADVDRVVRETSLPYVLERLEHARVHTVAYTLRLDGRSVRKRAIFSYLDNDRRVLLGALQDITETYQTEEKQKTALAAALSEAEHANRAKTEFFSRMSHDMRTPMNGILGLAELARTERDPDELRRSIGKIRQSGQYLLSLINDTLDFQRIESGKMKLEPQVVRASTLLDGIMELIRPVAEEKKVELRVLPGGLNPDCHLRVDPVRVKQVFLNLLSNAVKFTPPGGAVSLDMDCTSREGMISHCRFRVVDTGMGMSEEFLQNGIFKPFSQESSAVSAQYTGSGLGLSIVRSLVELMGGSVSVESELGVGTTFTVLIDVERVNEVELLTDAREDEKRQQDALRALKGRRVLLVEDHPLNAEIAQKLLARADCEAVWAHDGKQGADAFAAAPEGTFDAILMDIRMPVMNGLESARAIRALPRADAPRVPIIAMTANAYEEDVQQSMEAGMNAHLAKPIDPKKLYETLGAALK